MEEVHRVVMTFKGASLKLKGKVFGSCVRSYMMYEIGSETWTMNPRHESMLEKTDM